MLIVFALPAGAQWAARVSLKASRGPLTAALLALAAAAAAPTGARLSAQTVRPIECDVVSIKRNTSATDQTSMRTLADGTFVMVNQTIRSIIMSAASVPVRDITGLPAWVSSERYDITAKPPAGATQEERGQMFRRMFEDRMQLRAHVEERDQMAFALVMDRADGRLGPAMSVSTLDCTGRVPQVQPPSMAEAKSRCGLSRTEGLIVSGGTTMEVFVRTIAGLAGGTVNDRTGLTGTYALTLRYTPRAGDAPGASVDNAPEFATALREQLGLRLRPERTTVPILVVESIARPSEN
jgi:uncharacterized protein (TIGR03435 family)